MGALKIVEGVTGNARQSLDLSCTRHPCHGTYVEMPQFPVQIIHQFQLHLRIDFGLTEFLIVALVSAEVELALESVCKLAGIVIRYRPLIAGALM
jgi:hypothetical protein